MYIESIKNVCSQEKYKLIRLERNSDIKNLVEWLKENIDEALRSIPEDRSKEKYVVIYDYYHNRPFSYGYGVPWNLIVDEKGKTYEVSDMELRKQYTTAEDYFIFLK